MNKGNYMKKIFLLTVLLLTTTVWAQQHTEFGKNSSFYKIVEATNNNNVQGLIYSTLENDNSLTLTGLTYPSRQPRCLNVTVITLNYRSSKLICKQDIVIGVCAISGSKMVKTLDELTCTDREL